MALLEFEAALDRIRQSVTPISDVESVSLSQGQGRVLADAIIAARANPAFNNSAVDGYLLGRAGARAGDLFKLGGEIRAGSGLPLATPQHGQAIRVFTGAPVPEGDFCVVMQEDVELEAGGIRLKEDVALGAAIRLEGDDFNVGAELAPKGSRLGAAELALAAWNGRATLSVHRAPNVAICLSGDELLEPGEPIRPGQIYDSNGPMLEAMVKGIGPAEVSRNRLPDDLTTTKEVLAREADRSDLILVSGGASVGDYDHLPGAIADLGEVLFHGVRIKPGKPTLFGKIGKSIVFALPGNPASSYVCFELFAQPALRILAGETRWEPIWVRARYDGAHSGGNRDEFERVRLSLRNDELWAAPQFEQGSFGLRSLSASHALVRLPNGAAVRPGDWLDVRILAARG